MSPVAGPSNVGSPESTRALWCRYRHQANCRKAGTPRMTRAGLSCSAGCARPECRSGGCRSTPLPRWRGHLVNSVRQQVASEQRPGRHGAVSSPRRSWNLEHLPGARNAVGARNGSQRVQPPSGVARPSQIFLAGQGLLVRLSPTVPDTQNHSGVP